VQRMRAERVLLSYGARKDVLRAVTHLGVSSEEIEQAIEAIAKALGVGAARGGAYAQTSQP
jgi:acetylornithine/succinyldiaminopimelate/putrescine aminotransferase